MYLKIQIYGTSTPSMSPTMRRNFSVSRNHDQQFNEKSFASHNKTTNHQKITAQLFLCIKQLLTFQYTIIKKNHLTCASSRHFGPLPSFNRP